MAALVPLLFALVFPAHAAAALFAAEGRDIRAEIEAARLEGRRLAVVFELPDCANCLKMKREVFSDQRAETDFGRAYRTVRIDLASVSPITDARGEVRTPQEFAQGLGLFATPSFAFFASDGSLEYRHAGGLASPSDLMRLGRFVAEALYEERPFSDYLHSSVKHHH
ncbi:MAG: thioredoxin fold domain-containing protein [Candidatus Accumulibacter sp.]|nr:thioredoxin fold domain-containing protein [Accumulibacter sp.]